MRGPTRKPPLWISCTCLYKYRLLLLTVEFIIISKSISHTLKLQHMSIITPYLNFLEIVVFVDVKPLQANIIPLDKIP